MGEKDLCTAIVMCIAGSWYGHRDYVATMEVRKVLRIFLRISTREGHDYGHLFMEGSSLQNELDDAYRARILMASYLSEAFCYKHTFLEYKERCLGKLSANDRARIETGVEYARTLLGRYGSPEQAVDVFEREYRQAISVDRN